MPTRSQRHMVEIIGQNSKGETYDTITGGSGAPVVLPVNKLDYFHTDAGPKAWYAGTTGYSLFYQNGKTYAYYQYHHGYSNKRLTKVRAYTHSSRTWGRSQGIGPEGLDGDAHGVPGACALADGRMFVAHGNHNGNHKISVSENPDDETEWVQAADLVGEYTYPHPVLRPGGGVTLLLRKRYQIGTGGYAGGAMVLCYRPYTFVGSTATVGAEVEMANMGNDTRWYQGPAILDGTIIWQTAARADFADIFRRDVYLVGIDTANARFQSWEAGTLTSFPVGITQLNSTYKLRTTPGSDEIEAPSFEKGSDGKWHIAACEGASAATSRPIYHMVSAGLGQPWSAFTATGSSGQGARLIREAGANMSIYFQRDGDIYRQKWNGSTWAAEELVMTRDATRFNLRATATVFNAVASARVGWAEDADNEDNSQVHPPKRMYMFGDSGLLKSVRPTASAPSTVTGPGVIFDPSDLSTLFSDTGGTTPAAVAGFVRHMKDKSGNALHAVGTGTEDPVLRYEGVGETYWLDFGDQSPLSTMLTPNYVPQTGNAMWMCVAGRCWGPSTPTQDWVSIDTGSTTNNRYMRLGRSVTNGGEATMTAYNSAGTAHILVNTGSLLGNATDMVMGGYIEGTALTYYEDGVERATGTLVGTLKTVAQAMRLGAGQSGTGAANVYMQGRIYGIIQRSGVVSLATRQADMAWLASKLPR